MFAKLFGGGNSNPQPEPKPKPVNVPESKRISEDELIA